MVVCGDRWKVIEVVTVVVVVVYKYMKRLQNPDHAVQDGVSLNLTCGFNGCQILMLSRFAYLIQED